MPRLPHRAHFACALVVGLASAGLAWPRLAPGQDVPAPQDIKQPKRQKPTQAADTGNPSDLELAAKSENPVSDLARFPIVNSTRFGIGDNSQVGNALLFAPIIPMSFGDAWSLITRTIVPIVTVPDVRSGSGSTTGLGDITLETLGHKLFVLPQGWLFDVALGPVFAFPTASDDVLGNGKWKLGPKLVTGLTINRLVAMVLVRNLWSIGGDEDRPDTNEFLLQFLGFYNLPKLWYLVSEPIITANWEASDDNRWTVPLGGGLGKLIRGNRWALTMRAQAFYNVVRPDFGAEWELRFTVALLNPNPLRFGG